MEHMPGASVTPGAQIMDVNTHKMIVLVVSCERFSDVWRPFFTLFWKYWSDCPYPVYLGANHTTWDDPRVTMLLTGDDKSWGSNTRKMVENVTTPFILLVLEDWLLTGPVDSSKIGWLLYSLEKLNGGYLCLDPAGARPDRSVTGFPDIGEIDRGAPYRVSLHIAIWRRDVLLELLKDETAWDLEILGSRRSDALAAGFFRTWKDAMRYDKGGVNRGKWTPSAMRLARREGIALDFSQRKKYTWEDTAKRYLGKVYSVPYALIPWRIRRAVGNWLRQAGLRKGVSR